MIFDDYSIKKDLPHNLKDKNFLAFSEIFDIILSDRPIFHVYTHLQDLNTFSLIDYLLFQQSVDSILTKCLSSHKNKKDLILRSFLLHKFKGTPLALETALSIYLAPTSISEWFNYGGRPYYFKPVINFSDARLFFQGDDKQNLLDVINEYKNARSWLDGLIFQFNFDDNDFIFDDIFSNLNLKYADDFFSDKNVNRYGNLFFPFTFTHNNKYDVDDISISLNLNLSDHFIEKIPLPFFSGDYVYGSFRHSLNDSLSFNLKNNFNEDVNTEEDFQFKAFKCPLIGKIKYGNFSFGRCELYDFT